MTFNRIQQLINLLPNNSSYFREILSYTSKVNSVNKFLCAYKDLAFGYHIVKSLILDNIEFPAEVIDEDVLYRTYLLEKYDAYDEIIVYAMALTHPGNKTMEDAVKAAIISDESYYSIGKAYGMPSEVIEAYEQLFFNVRDRKNEALFIANLVYPDTRLVELSENYFKTEDKGRIIMRSAYNNGLGDASYFIGLKNMNNLINSGLNSVDSASQLEAAIMVNGLFLARNGALNAKTSGINQAKGILIAAKQGGQDTSNTDTEGIGTLGDTAMGFLQDMVNKDITLPTSIPNLPKPADPGGNKLLNSDSSDTDKN